MNHTRWVFCVLALVLSGGTTASIAGKTAAKAKAKPLPLNISLTGTEGQISQPDPKLPGKYLWKMYVKSGSGAPQGSGFLGRLTGVTAVLYQKGVESAVMTAPTASGNSAAQNIVATGPGRVRVRSLTEAGTTLEADRMTWYARTNKIIAQGNVVYHDGKTGAAFRVPRAPVNADTRLKSVFFGKGTGTLP